MRKLEGLFAVLIATMALSFAWMFNETKPSVEELFIGNLKTEFLRSQHCL